MLYTTIEIHIPEAMKPYVTEKNAEDELQRNALLLYIFIRTNVRIKPIQIFKIVLYS